MSKVELVKELRARTGAGMSDCIKALNETNNNVEEAIEWLRKNTALKAAKKATAVAAEGVTISLASENAKKVILFELNCQTDFVSKNDKFVNLYKFIGNELLSHVDGEKHVESHVARDGKTFKALCEELTGVIGEKIELRRVRMLLAHATQSIGHYTHMNQKIASAILCDGTASPEVLKNLAMHIAAMSPRYISLDEIPAEVIKHEKEIATEQVHEEIKAIENEKQREGKLKNIDRAIEGRVNKVLGEQCLLNQKLIIDSSKTVEQYLKEHHLKAVEFVNLVLGEGIEKKVDDFAAEVEKQMKAAN